MTEIPFLFSPLITSHDKSGGILQATPHAVNGCNQGGVSRESFAVFMQPE